MTLSTQVDFRRLRSTEYSRLDRAGQVYLDYTGSGLYPESLIRRHCDLLTLEVFGNPHSANPTSLESTRMLEECRSAILAFFNADPDEYEAVFTQNATGALKLVGEAYPFAATTPYALTYDNHNSVNGVREFARARGADFAYIPITDPDLRIDREALAAVLRRPDRKGGLLAFPAQSNFSGVQHDLSIIAEAQALGWHVLVDAAAFVPTNRLDLSRFHPDFLPVSFYKMFGYPTGVGCLLVRREAAAALTRPWFAGGTVLLARACAVPCEQQLGYVWDSSVAGFEDGTPNFLAIPAVKYGIEYLNTIGIDAIHDHVSALTTELLDGLKALRHSNGKRLVHVYGPDTMDRRGATVALNLFDQNEELIHSRDVEQAASKRGISVRTGCHCNPGAGQTALHITDEEFERVFVAGTSMSRDRFRVAAGAMREGAVRISLGIASNAQDVRTFLEFLAIFVDDTPSG